MKLGLCTIAAPEVPLEQIAAAAAKYKLDGLELTDREPHLKTDATPMEAEDAARVIRDAGLEVFAFGSYLGSEKQRRGRDAKRAVEITVALGAPLLRVWAEDFDGSIPLIQQACDAAAPQGIAVVIERHNYSLADTPERIESLLQEINRPNAALNYQPLDGIPQAKIMAQAREVSRLIPLSRYMHIKNYWPGENLKPFASIESGALDYPELLRLALQAGFLGPASIEFLSNDSQPFEIKLSQDASFLRTLLKMLTSQGDSA